MSEMSLAAMFARKARGACPFCGTWGPFEFKDKLSEKEFSLSGLCQSCQDKTFAEPITETRREDTMPHGKAGAEYVTSFAEHEPTDDLEVPEDHTAPLKREQELEDAGTTAEEVNQFKREGW